MAGRSSRRPRYASSLRPRIIRIPKACSTRCRTSVRTANALRRFLARSLHRLRGRRVVASTTGVSTRGIAVLPSIPRSIRSGRSTCRGVISRWNQSTVRIPMSQRWWLRLRVRGSRDDTAKTIWTRSSTEDTNSHGLFLAVCRCLVQSVGSVQVRQLSV